MPFIAGLQLTLKRLLQLALLGLGVGVACLPFNWLDHGQDQLLQFLPFFSAAGWDLQAWMLAALSLLAMPVLLLLQSGRFRDGAGSGIPQTMVCLDAPELGRRFLGPGPTLRRLLLWSIATLALLPLGREGPVVQMGAAVAHGLRRRFPGFLKDLAAADVLAVAAGAGLAAGFNTPLMATVFVAEELTSRFQISLIWPAMLTSAVAAGLSNLGGQPMFALGLLSRATVESNQLLWAVPIGVLAGLVGAGFGRLLLAMGSWLQPWLRRRPLQTGLVLGLALMVLMLVSGGAAGGDGEALMHRLVASIDEPLPPVQLLAALLARILGPCLALGAGVPGGLIDPAFAIGALLGHGVGSLLGLQALGLALGMTAGLAGATQLPLVSLTFALRLAGDQQLLPGMLLAAVIGAYVSRLVMPKPVYHALTEPLQDSLAAHSLPA